MPAIRPDGVSIGPLHAGVLDLVGKPEYRDHAGERGRWRGRQLPVDRVDRMTSSLATVVCFI
jgi:hypothetical protein